MKLTPKQKMFADYYIISLDPAQSYLKAGYNVKNMETAYANAHRLLKNAKVRAYIDEQMLSKDNERIASADEVLEKLTRQMRGEEYEEVVVSYQKNYEIAKKQISPREQQKAAELLGKRYALFTEKHDISGDIGLHINVDYGDTDE